MYEFSAVLGVTSNCLNTLTQYQNEVPAPSRSAQGSSSGTLQGTPEAMGKTEMIASLRAMGLIPDSMLEASEDQAPWSD
jgi:hypothetical protein